MIKKKICMLGAFAVGKTSLVQRFVKSIFSDKYLTTVGVKIEKKTLNIGEEEIHLVLHLGGQFPGRFEDEALRLGAGHHLGEDGQGEGGRLAGASLGGPHDVASIEGRGHGLGLDGGGGFVSRFFDGAEDGLRKPEIGKR